MSGVVPKDCLVVGIATQNAELCKGSIPGGPLASSVQNSSHDSLDYSNRQCYSPEKFGALKARFPFLIATGYVFDCRLKSYC